MDAYSGQCVVVVGSQWGDEGKGKIVDHLSAGADLIVRYQGGANAGHTVVVGEEEYILHQIPTGILHPGKICILGNGVVLDPQALFEEIGLLEGRGMSLEGRLLVSGKAHLVLPHHRHLDKLEEDRRGEGRLGTTGRGIGPTYQDKVARRGMRVGDLADPQRARKILEGTLAEKARLVGDPSNEAFDPAVVWAAIETYRERLLALACDASQEISRALGDGKRLLLEGAQGSLLDLDHGTYPYVTSSNTTAGAAAVGAGIGPTAIDRVLGVVKAYTTRVGEGPLPTELAAAEGAQLRDLGREYGATTGRARRCGWFDAVVVRYAARINGLTGLAVTKLDVLDPLPNLKICCGYRARGDVFEEFPYDYGILSECEPMYEEVPGWEEPIGELREFDGLPENAKAYLHRIEDLVGVPVEMVSVGMKREQVIVRGAAVQQ